jgi:methyl-accepting chemotaxis protein
VTEDTFRMVVTAAVALASIAFVVQAMAMFALYRVARRMQQKVGPLADQAEPVIGKLGPMIGEIGLAAQSFGPMIDKVGLAAGKVAPVADQLELVLATANRIMEETRPRISELSGEAVEIVRSGREQVERIGELLHDAGDCARTRLEQIDQAVESTVEQVGQVGDAVKRAVLRPVREVNGLAAGISAAVATLVHHSRKPSVDQATQDEEMFI